MLATVPRREDVDIKTRLRVAGHLRNKMRELGLSQVAVAKMIGVSQGAVSRILNGTGALGLDVFIRIHRQLHIDANLLLDVEPKAKV